MTSGKPIILDLDTFKSVYETEGSVIKTAEYFNLSFDGLRSWMKRNNIELIYKKKYKVNEKFFLHNNERSFYWAGFIAADGCVLEKNKDFPWILKICLSIKDLKHLELFLNHIQSTYKIHYGKSKSPSSCETYKHCYVSIHSKKICDDLSRFNILPRKTLAYHMPNWLLNHDLLHHFMRGYIDGDGCFSSTKARNRNIKQITFNVLGTNEMINQIVDVFYNNGINKNKVTQIYDNGISRAQYSGNRVLNKIYLYLYADASTFLKRKEKIASMAGSLIQKKTPSKEKLINLLKELKTKKKVAKRLNYSYGHICELYKAIKPEYQ